MNDLAQESGFHVKHLEDGKNIVTQKNRSPLLSTKRDVAHASRRPFRGAVVLSLEDPELAGGASFDTSGGRGLTVATGWPDSWVVNR